MQVDVSFNEGSKHLFGSCGWGNDLSNNMDSSDKPDQGARSPQDSNMVEGQKDSCSSIGSDGNKTRFGTPTLHPYHDAVDQVIEEDVLSKLLPNLNIPINKPWFSSDKFPDTVPTWPHTSTAWVSWVERMKNHFKSSWKKWNIYEAINLSIHVPTSSPTYLYTFLSFWSSDLNCFAFPWGMMGPTLLDVAMITGLPISGRELPEFHNRPEELSALSLTRKNTQWNAFTTEFQQSSDVAAEAEHKAFLLYWFCRYVACVGSKSIVKAYSKYVDALMSGQPISFGRFFLGLLFQGINRSLKKLADGKNPGTTMTGPWWFLQMWISLYFPDLFESVTAPSPSTSSTTYGQNAQHALSYSGNERDVFNYILHRTPGIKDFYPYDVRLGCPEFLFHQPNTEDEEGLKEVAPHWNSMMKPHPLMVGYEIGMVKNKNNPITVEPYSPHYLARQLGCQQGIPRPCSVFAELELVAGEALSDLQVKEISKRRDMLQTQHSYLPFQIRPAERNDHKRWWEAVGRQIFVPDLDSYRTKILETEKVKKKTIKVAQQSRPRKTPKADVASIEPAQQCQPRKTCKTDVATSEPAQSRHKRSIATTFKVQSLFASTYRLICEEAESVRVAKGTTKAKRMKMAEEDCAEIKVNQQSPRSTTVFVAQPPEILHPVQDFATRYINDDPKVPSTEKDYAGSFEQEMTRTAPFLDQLDFIPVEKESSPAKKKKKTSIFKKMDGSRVVPSLTTHGSPIHLDGESIINKKNGEKVEKMTKKSTDFPMHTSRTSLAIDEENRPISSEEKDMAIAIEESNKLTNKVEGEISEKTPPKLTELKVKHPVERKNSSVGEEGFETYPLGQLTQKKREQVQEILSLDLSQAIDFIPKLQALWIDMETSTEVVDRTDIKERLDLLVLRTTELEGDFPTWHLRDLEARQAFKTLDGLPSQKGQFLDQDDQRKKKIDSVISKRQSLIARQAELRHMIIEAKAELKNINEELRAVDYQETTAETRAVGLAEEITRVDDEIQRSAKLKKVIATRQVVSRAKMDSMEESWMWIKECWQWILDQVSLRQDPSAF